MRLLEKWISWLKNEWVADGAWQRETGSLFHSDGPATANAHRPNELDILASHWVQSRPLCNTVPTRPSSKHLLQRRSTLLFNFPLDATTSFVDPSEFHKLLEIYQNYSWKSTGNLFLRFCRHPAACILPCMHRPIQLNKLMKMQVFKHLWNSLLQNSDALIFLTQHCHQKKSSLSNLKLQGWSFKYSN